MGVKKTRNIDFGPDDIIQRAYYLDGMTIKKLDYMYADTGIDKSDIICMALNKYIPEKYTSMAIESFKMKLSKDELSTLKYININSFEDITNSPGVYFIYGKNYKLLYVGQALNIRRRIKDHLSGTKINNTAPYKDSFKLVKFIIEKDANLRDGYESFYIRKYEPFINVHLNKD